MALMEIEGVRPHRKRGYWFFIRRVPKEYQAFEKRRLIFQSTGIAIPEDPLGLAARVKVRDLNAAVERYWRDLAAGIDAEAVDRYEKAVAEAYRVGRFAYRTEDDLVQNATIEELGHRVLAAMKNNGSFFTLNATLGGEEVPGMAVSTLVDKVEKIRAVAHMKKSPAQRKRWRRPRELALETLIETIGGDRPVAKLTKHDVRAYVDFWEQRVLDGEILVGTANKNIRYVASMFRLVNRKERWDLDDIFLHTTIEGGKKGKRVKFDVDFIQDRILADGAFEGVNPEARGVLYLMVETGIRPSEACGLTEATIRLDCDIPHVQVVEEGRQVKSENAVRTIPLVGVSLMAMQANPKGFPRYWDAADSLSALMNKVLDVRGLRPEKGQTLYSLRHSFESRMGTGGVDERVRSDVMGHTYYREKYGDGGTLAFKRDCLQRIALRPPKSV